MEIMRVAAAKTFTTEISSHFFCEETSYNNVQGCKNKIHKFDFSETGDF